MDGGGILFLCNFIGWCCSSGIRISNEKMNLDKSIASVKEELKQQDAATKQNEKTPSNP
jgi:hypothetical protein